jgi:hypothetical protein
LMQDRSRQIDETLLRRTAGPYIWVTSERTAVEQMESALIPRADIDWKPISSDNGMLSEVRLWVQPGRGHMYLTKIAF